MSNPYDPVEAELRADLVDARLKLYHERCRREQAEACLAVAERKIEWLRKADRLVIWTGTEWQVRHQLDGKTEVSS